MGNSSEKKKSRLSYLINKMIAGFKMAGLGGDLQSALILLYFNYLPFLQKRSGFFRYKERRVTISKFGRKHMIFLDGEHDEYEILKEIMINEEYQLDVPAPKIIFDLGSNVGFSAIYFALKYPLAKIFAFEPDPANFTRLQKNIGALGNIKIENMAVAGSDGDIDFFPVAGKGISSSLISRRAGQASIKVKARCLDSLITEYAIPEIDILKIDVEGAEYEIFSSATMIDRVGAIIGELHLDLMGADFETFKHCLSGHSFESSGASKEKRMFFKAFRI